MSILLQVILPVFLVIGFGYLAVWQKWFSDSGVEALMKFTQTFAIPCLLFRAVSTLDLSQTFHFALLGSFYFGAVCGFCLGLFGARFLFKRTWDDSVAIGFCCLFSNSVLLGLPITERAYGTAALTANFAIIAVHAPICYGIGITVMELVRGRGSSAPELLRKVLQAIFKNALVIALGLGFFVNLLGIILPVILTDGLDLLANAALPAALFGLGGVLVRYRPEGDLRVIFYICAISLLVHPSLVWITGRYFDLSETDFRSAILTAAMAPGINAYIFANMYGTARRVAASAVLISTALTIITASFWLFALG
jgi:malonate transporter|tara:strand:+ start:3368 stop:4297 length:930 start_codon:yes stop_codon:yes gene_type:complete